MTQFLELTKPISENEKKGKLGRLCTRAGTGGGLLGELGRRAGGSGPPSGGGPGNGATRSTGERARRAMEGAERAAARQAGGEKRRRGSTRLAKMEPPQLKEASGQGGGAVHSPVKLDVGEGRTAATGRR